MKYVFIPSKKEEHVVVFRGDSDHEHIFDKSSKANEFFLKQEVKSWLVKNDIKIFVTYTCNVTDGSIPEFTIKFQNKADAEQFVEYWDQKHN